MISKISKIVVGVWPLSGDFGPVVPSDYEKSVFRALELGIKSFDTAPNYGNGYSESALGLILQGVKNVNINTKLGSLPFGDKKFGLDDLKISFENSLKRLRVDKINYIFLHNPRDEVKDFEKIIDFMQNLKSNNLINNYGISIAKGFEYRDISKFEGIQLDCNLLYLKDFNKYSDDNQKIFARSPLASGILSGKLKSNSEFHKTDYRSSWLNGKRLDGILNRLEIIKKNIPDFTLPSLARKFLLFNNKIDKVIFGVKNAGHVEDIIDDLSSQELDNSIIKKIIQLEKNNFYQTDNKGF